MTDIRGVKIRRRRDRAEIRGAVISNGRKKYQRVFSAKRIARWERARWDLLSFATYSAEFSAIKAQRNKNLAVRLIRGLCPRRFKVQITQTYPISRAVPF